MRCRCEQLLSASRKRLEAARVCAFAARISTFAERNLEEVARDYSLRRGDGRWRGQAQAASCYNPEHHSKLKHVQRRHFFIRQVVEDHQIVVPYVETDKNLADFFTKPLPARKFFELRKAIMNEPNES